MSSVPTDPGALSRLGQIHTKEDDETQAFHYHSESYRYYPVNLDVISWLGVWFVKNEVYEKAIHYFQRAAKIQPKEVKWRLMVTSCYRRMGSYQRALELYEEIHRDEPENIECLRYLVAICKDLGMKYEHYQTQLAKAERIQQAKTQSNLAGGILTQAGGARQAGGQQAAQSYQQQQQQQQRSAQQAGRAGSNQKNVSRPSPIMERDERPTSHHAASGVQDVHSQLQTRAVRHKKGDDDDVVFDDDDDIDDLFN